MHPILAAQLIGIILESETPEAEEDAAVEPTVIVVTQAKKMH